MLCQTQESYALCDQLYTSSIYVLLECVYLTLKGRLNCYERNDVQTLIPQKTEQSRYRPSNHFSATRFRSNHKNGR